MKKEKDFYCRQRNCIHHDGISKNGNVLCKKRKLFIVKTKDGIVCNSIFISKQKHTEPSKLKSTKPSKNNNTLDIGDVSSCLKVDDETALQPIQDALYSTRKFTQDDSNQLADIILNSIKENGLIIAK
jgi:hypothetical protein